MNDELKERVKALAVEAGMSPACYESEISAMLLERFAQAVARDCMWVVEDYGRDWGEAVHAIRARYGVKD